MHARFYNPQTGRFLSTDPGDSAKQRAPQSWNLYAYTLGNPLKYIDPDGAESVGIAIDQFNRDLLEGQATVDDFGELIRGRLVMTPLAIGGGFGSLALTAPSTALASIVAGQGLLVRTAPAVSSPALAAITRRLFKTGDRFVGGTANAIRHELATGQGVAGRIHLQAGLERLKGLQDLLRGGGLNGSDTGTAMRLASDLQNSVQPVLARLGMTADQLRKALSSGQLTQEEILKLMKK